VAVSKTRLSWNEHAKFKVLLDVGVASMKDATEEAQAAFNDVLSGVKKKKNITALMPIRK